MTTTALLRRAVTVSTSALLLVSAAGCGGSGDSSMHADNPGGVVISGVHESGPFFGAEPQRPYRMPDVTLTATNDQPFNLIRDTAYPVTLVFFGYTNCPDVCPLVMSDLTSTYLHLPRSCAARRRSCSSRPTPRATRRRPCAVTSPLRQQLRRPHRQPQGHRLGGRRDGGGDLGQAQAAERRLRRRTRRAGDRLPQRPAPVIWTGARRQRHDMVSDISRLAGS